MAGKLFFVSTDNNRILVFGVLALAMLTASCTPGSESKKELSVKSRQYFVQGEKLYITHCSNCHQTNGAGLGLLYPPLNKSDYMDNNFEGVVCLIRNGIDGEMFVNGKQFNKKMPGIPSLTDLEITEITTYIYNKWEHSRDSIVLQDVSRILRECGDSTNQK